MSIVDAERRLLASALLDGANQRFLLLSESCVPLWNFTFVANYLLGTRMGFLHAKPPHKKHTTYQKEMLPEVIEKQWRKGSQWFALTRKLSVEAISDKEIYAKFATLCKHPCYSDEHYLQTLLSIKRDDEIEHRSITWYDFKKGGKHPASFKNNDLDVATLEKIKGEPACTWNGVPNQTCHLIARKFLPETLDKLLDLAQGMGY